ncbi:hypothetical protein PR048_011982 [Dryococelus australis]|uniref:Integrase catalytic domain-containing protein n=1 Tax=Dryococelus australis TaxID=614101 RepID=A0ABQ9HN74_9NEOP|nr:hypothetical protein PR048_011982 [Dryococelus australis]
MTVSCGQSWGNSNRVSMTYPCQEIAYYGRIVWWFPGNFKVPYLKSYTFIILEWFAMKELARCYFWQPGLDADIELMVGSCQLCQETRYNAPCTQNSFSSKPKGKWQRLHTDFLGPHNGKNYFIVVDAYTKWLEIIPMGSLKTAAVIRALWNLFSVVSNNGTSFTPEEFHSFLKNNGIQHVLMRLYDPASNGMAEWGVQTAKNAIRRLNGMHIEIKLPKYLLMYRNMSKLITGKSLAELLFSRRLRTVFDNVHPDCQPCMPKHMENLRIFQPDQPVWERKHSDLWKPAVVVNQEGNMCYKVLLEGDVSLRHGDELHKLCQTNGKT